MILSVLGDLRQASLKVVPSCLGGRLPERAKGLEENSETKDHSKGGPVQSNLN